jgi:hypothetical protein
MRKPPPGATKAPPQSRMRPPPVAKIKAPPRGELPHARRPAIVRDVHGNELGDLFVMFPDLPRVPLPPRRRVPQRMMRRAR